VYTLTLNLLIDDGRHTPTDTYNGKAVLDFEGEMVFAELAILRAFERKGCASETHLRQRFFGFVSVTLVPSIRVKPWLLALFLLAPHLRVHSRVPNDDGQLRPRDRRALSLFRRRRSLESGRRGSHL
jgi:hypothetical protein